MAAKVKSVNDCADVTVVIKQRRRYTFNQKLDVAQIREAVLKGDYFDVIDEEDLEVLGVGEVRL